MTAASLEEFGKQACGYWLSKTKSMVSAVRHYRDFELAPSGAASSATIWQWLLSNEERPGLPLATIGGSSRFSLPSRKLLTRLVVSTGAVYLDSLVRPDCYKSRCLSCASGSMAILPSLPCWCSTGYSARREIGIAWERSWVPASTLSVWICEIMVRRLFERRIPMMA